MSEEKLPKSYKGYSTAELVALWGIISYKPDCDVSYSMEELQATHSLIREYKIMDFDDGNGDNDSAKIRRSKALLAPFGVDPAPWADENGMEDEELSRRFCDDITEREGRMFKKIRMRQRFAKTGVWEELPGDERDFEGDEEDDELDWDKINAWLESEDEDEAGDDEGEGEERKDR